VLKLKLISLSSAKNMTNSKNKTIHSLNIQNEVTTINEENGISKNDCDKGNQYLFIDLISIINQQYELESILNPFNKLFFCSFSFIYQSNDFILIFLEFGQSSGSCSTWSNTSFLDNSISISKQAPSYGCKNCKVVADIGTQNWSNFFYWDLTHGISSIFRTVIVT
jgi:hypothetical protein